MKNFIVVVSVIVAVASVIFSLTLLKKIDEKEKEKYEVKKAIQVEAEIISRKIDKEGIEHVTIEATKNVLPLPLVKNTVVVGAGILDTTALAIGILKNQVKELLVINSTLKAENLKAREETRNGQRYLSYSDKTLGISYRPPLTTDTSDRGTLNLDYYNSQVSVTQYWKRKWFLGSKKGYIDISTNDIRNTINGVKQLTVEQKQPSFGLRIQGSFNYMPSKGDYGIGPSMRVDIGRLSLNGNYNWFPNEQRWINTVSANYDLIRF